MLFKTELIEKIVAGEKTQTRRPVKMNEIPSGDGQCVFIKHARGLRVKVAVGSGYAVQPGRGQAGIFWHPEKKVLITKDARELVEARAGVALTDGIIPLRIRVTNIRCEDVREISHNDAVAEGFPTGRVAFWKVWCEFYDQIVVPVGVYDSNVRALLRSRPNEKYQAWAYTFEVLR